jgi:hypothetical protein
MKLINIFDRLGKQPLNVTQHTDAMVAIGDQNIGIQDIRYENGVPTGFELERTPVIWCIKVLEKVEPYIYKYIYEEDEDSGFNDYGSTRVWGFYYDREKCVQALHENATDMHEGCYDYAVMESYHEGICGAVHGSVQWFQWDKEQQGYFEIPVPDRESHTCSYCMG